MAYARKVDASHAAIRDGLRKLGWSVADTSGVGGDFPDLAAGKDGWCTVLIECKTRRAKTARSRITPDHCLSDGQRTFKELWRGFPVVVGFTLEDVVFQIEQLRKKHALDAR